MKILIVSDSHGRISNLSRVIDLVSPIDALIHLGDFEGHEDEVELLSGCKTYLVAGNNDYFTNLEREMVIELGPYKAFLTHGHRYGVSYGTDRLKDVARAHGANIAMYGHTHYPCIDQKGDITVVNPGSISLPRQDGRIPTYIIMEIDPKGIAHYTLNYFK